MSAAEVEKTLRGLSIEKLMEACEKWNADPHEVIARALTDEMREQAEISGMTMKEQAKLAWSLIDKAEPSKKAVEFSGTLNHQHSAADLTDDDLANIAKGGG